MPNVCLMDASVSLPREISPSSEIRLSSRWPVTGLTAQEKAKASRTSSAEKSADLFLMISGLLAGGEALLVHLEQCVRQVGVEFDGGQRDTDEFRSALVDDHGMGHGETFDFPVIA